MISLIGTTNNPMCKFPTLHILLTISLAIFSSHILPGTGSVILLKVRVFMNPVVLLALFSSGSVSAIIRSGSSPQVLNTVVGAVTVYMVYFGKSRRVRYECFSD